MRFFVEFDPLNVSMRDLKAIALVGKLARIKDWEKFKPLMVEVVYQAYCMALSHPASLKEARRISRLVSELQKALADNPEVAEDLEYSDVKAVSNIAEYLADTLHRLERQKKYRRPGKWRTTIRQQFVNGLLDAVEAAGGRLGLDRQNGRGSLDDAIKLLQPLLRKDEFQSGLSRSTQRDILVKRAKTKNCKN